MTYFVGDEVKLKSGELAEVIDTWGVARSWHKVRTTNNKIKFAMTDEIDSVVKRFSDKKKRRWGAK